MAQSQHSKRNVTSSVAWYLAQRLLEAGYVVYWHRIDAVQTSDAWYYSWSTQFPTYQADPVVADVLAEAKGLITLRAHDAKALFPVRHTGDGSVAAYDEAQVPYLTIDVGEEGQGPPAGLGMWASRRVIRWRTRNLTIYGCARDEDEQSALCDLLIRDFDEALPLELLDFEAGTQQVVGDLLVELPLVDSATDGTETEAARFELILNAQLRYEA